MIRRTAAKTLHLVHFLTKLPGLARFWRSRFSGRTIAIVGSAPGTVGKGYGALIDSHDIVIRINLLQVEGREPDLGRRCDYRFVGCSMDPLRLELLLLDKSTRRFISDEKNFDALFNLGRELYLYPKRTPWYATYLLKWRSWSAVPTHPVKPVRSGMVLLAQLLAFSRPAKVRLFGFSSNSGDALQYRHYTAHGTGVYDDPNYLDLHADPLLEVEILENLHRQGIVELH